MGQLWNRCLLHNIAFHYVAAEISVLETVRRKTFSESNETDKSIITSTRDLIISSSWVSISVGGQDSAHRGTKTTEVYLGFMGGLKPVWLSIYSS